MLTDSKTNMVSKEKEPRSRGRSQLASHGVGPKRDCPSDKRGGEHGWALSPQLTSTHAEGKAPDLRGGTRRPTGTAVTRDGRTQGSLVLARRTSPAAGTRGPSDLSCPSWGGT